MFVHPQEDRIAKILKEFPTKEESFQREQQFLSQGKLQELSQINFFYGLSFFALSWLVVGLAIYISEHTNSLLVILLSLLVIGGRQLALITLMHEAAHYRVSQIRWLNDFIGNILAAWPLWVTVEGYRREHLSHHRLLGTENDIDKLAFEHLEDYRFPKTTAQMFKSSLAHLVGLRTLRFYLTNCYYAKMSLVKGSPYNIFRLSYYVLIFTIINYFDVLPQYFLYWALPSLTVLPLLMYFRFVADHYGTEGAKDFTRNMFPSLLERPFLDPHHVGRHLDHHLFSSVPHYNLNKLHHELLKSSDYLAITNNVCGYASGLWQQLKAKKTTKLKNSMVVGNLN